MITLKRLFVGILVISLQCQPFAEQGARQVSAQVVTRKSRPVRTELIYAVNAGAAIAQVTLNYRAVGLSQYRRVSGKKNYQANYYFSLDYYSSFEYFFEVRLERDGIVRIPSTGNEKIVADELATVEGDQSRWSTVGWAILTGIIAAATAGIVTANKSIR